MTNINTRKRLSREGRTVHLNMTVSAFREGGWTEVLLRWSTIAGRHLETSIAYNPVTGGISVYCKPKDSEYVSRAIHEMEIIRLTNQERRRQEAKGE